MKIEKCVNLKHLYLRKYSPTTKDLTELSELKTLEQLYIIQSPINSIKGVGELKKLRELELSYVPKLEMLTDLENIADSLEVLFMQNCKNLKNHEYAKKLQKLKTLVYLSCGEIPTIKFIDQMPNLVDFRFSRTNVVDGNLTPCLRLDYTAFDNKKHYSHKFEEIKKIVEEGKTKMK